MRFTSSEKSFIWERRSGFFWNPWKMTGGPDNMIGSVSGIMIFNYLLTIYRTLKTSSQLVTKISRYKIAIDLLELHGSMYCWRRGTLARSYQSLYWCVLAVKELYAHILLTTYRGHWSCRRTNFVCWRAVITNLSARVSSLQSWFNEAPHPKAEKRA